MEWNVFLDRFRMSNLVLQPNKCNSHFKFRLGIEVKKKKYWTHESLWESDSSGNWYFFFEKPGKPLKLGLEKVKYWESGVGILQNAQNVGIQSGKCPELPRKTSFVQVLSQSDSSSSSEDSADMSSSSSKSWSTSSSSSPSKSCCLLFLWTFFYHEHSRLEQSALLLGPHLVWVAIRQIDCRASIRSILQRARGSAIHLWPISCPFIFFAPNSTS